MCISTAHFTVLFSGSPKGQLQGTRGIRQGDPLSPLLFAIIAEGLCHMIVKAQELHMIIGFKVIPNSESIPLLLNMDDTTIFINDNVDAGDNLKAIQFWFGQILGILINENKSKIIQVG